QLDRYRIRTARAVVDDDEPGRTRGQGTHGLGDEGAVSAGDERDVSGERSWPEKRLGRVVRVGLRAAEAAVDCGTVRPRERADVDDPVRGERVAPGEERAGCACDRDV